MNAGLPAMGSSHTGRTTIRPQAIRHLVEAIAAEAAGVPATRVNATLGDERGRLTVRVATPVALTATATPNGSLVGRASELALAVKTGLDELAGRSVRHVDVRITGVNRSDKRRVL